jgi:hypothetical protein
MAIIGPSRDSRKSLFAGENPAGVRDSPLWGMDSSGFHSGHKYCHNGDMAFAYRHDGARRGEAPGRGVRDRHLGPFRGPLKAALLQGKKPGVHDLRPLGSGMDTSAFGSPGRCLGTRFGGFGAQVSEASDDRLARLTNVDPRAPTATVDCDFGRAGLASIRADLLELWA